MDERGPGADWSSIFSASNRLGLPELICRRNGMARFIGLRLINHGAAENWKISNQGHAKEYLFLAPCTVEEARRDAGQMPFRYTLNNAADLALIIESCPENFAGTIKTPGFMR